ncbi:fimbrial protein [Aeromonas salmonicida]|uniref:fimbrial protein n=1 Tax=Aeromonas salmonicida TaxID=645 RepID=UPI0039A6DF61
MKINSATTIVMMLMLSGSVFAADAPAAGGGMVKFIGSIIDSPCSIAPESADQTIQMGQISNSILEKQGEGPLRPFEIHLEGCAADTVKTASITFNGIPDDTDKTHLSINGFAKGAAIAMVSQLDGSAVVLGTPTKAMSLVEGDNHLKFGAKIVSNVKSGGKVTPGEFSATTDFVMAYQ